MAKDSGLSEILPVVLIGGAAWVAWSLYQSYQAGLTSAAAAPATPASPASTQTPSAPAPASSPAVVIPAGFTVIPGANNSWQGTVTYNGSPTTFNVILANAGNSSGVVWNTAGTDVTALLGAANVTTLVNAFQQASTAYTVAGGAPAPAGAATVIVAPQAVLPQRVILTPVLRTGIINR
jgi:hypothetical protein